MNIDWMLNGDLRVWGSPNYVCCGAIASFCSRNWIGL